jgi:hypothetical protein
MRIQKLALMAAVTMAAPALCPAAVLFSENFDAGDASDRWRTNRVTAGATGNAADYGFDYSTVGIPTAPNSVGGSTVGLKLEANVPGTGVFTGLSVSPLDQAFTGNFTLRADVWQNFNGPFPAGGSGSTQVTWAGIGTNGTAPQFPGTSVQGIGFGATADGGSQQDYRAYVNTGAPVLPSTGAYPAGTNDGTPAANAPNDSRQAANPYYVNAGFGSETATAEQLLLFPQQTGATAPGTQGMAWHRWEIIRNENIVTWTIDGVVISSVDVTAEPFGGDNFFLGYFDINATSSADPNARSLLFGVFDNVEVVDVIPEPSALSLVAVAGLAALRRRRRD